MARIDRTKFDITKTNDAVDRLLEVTTNARHRFKLDPADVVTTQQAAQILAPNIKPLPTFDEAVLGCKRSAG